ncbi:2-C-methyl-D-erythritol 4-phosphate cytidylyltransferase [bacterium]|nr:2-C-methyl-D-erythritol 4-phosphate cytidylyltransferase [bacterium]
MYPIDAILLGAGSGTRYTRSSEQFNPLPKQFHLIEEKPVFVWALESLVKETTLRRLIIVADPNYEGLARQLLKQYFSNPSHLDIHFVSGGKRRQDSSWNALNFIKSLKPWPKTVLIHDACRPFLGDTLRNGMESFSAQQQAAYSIPAIPMTETIKEVSNQSVVATLDRTKLVRVQTPQLFDFAGLLEVVEKSLSNPDINFTDDASILEHYGKTVSVFPGDERNVKLTYESDSCVLAQYLKTQKRNPPCESEPVTTFTV